MKTFLGSITVRGIIDILIIIIVGVAIFRTCVAEKRYNDLKESTENVKPSPETPVIKEAEEIARQVNKDGQEEVIYRMSEPLIKLIEDNAKVDSITKVANIEKNKVSSITTINGSLSKENLDLKRIISQLENGSKDTVFRYSDKWLSIDAFRSNDSVFRINRVWADMSINKIDYSRKKYWLVGKNENLAKIWYNSPYARVEGLETVTVRQKEPLFDVNLNAEGKYLHNQKEVLIGPSLNIKIGRFGLDGGYYINPGGNIGNGFWYGGKYRLY